MSLAMTAASIDDKNEPTILERKRHANNKTQKRISSEFIRADKVNPVLNSIHNTIQSEDSEYLGDFNSKYSSVKNYQPITTPINPYAKQPQQQQQQQEGMTNKGNNDYDTNTNNTTNYSSKFVPQPQYDDNMDLQELSDVYMNNEQVKKYFKNLIPTYDAERSTGEKEKEKERGDRPFQNRITNHNSINTGSNDMNQVLIDKLNYMINLLEEQQDERTNNVTEEVILYSFLGIFIIFVVDSFARVSKYVR
jgi:hypothetical protein